MGYMARLHKTKLSITKQEGTHERYITEKRWQMSLV